MSNASDDAGRKPRRAPRIGGHVLAREGLRYTLAVLGYIAIGLVTKQYLTFTWGLLYFVTVLEVIPRLVRRIRGRGTTPGRAAADTGTQP